MGNDPFDRARAGRVRAVVSPVLLLSVTVILLALCQQTLMPRLPSLATVCVSSHRTSSRRPIRPNPHFPPHCHAAIRISAPGGPGSSREARGRGRDPLRDHRAVVGRETRTPWYIRVRSLMLLVLIVIGMGMAIAGVALLLIASGRFVLEILAG